MAFRAFGSRPLAAAVAVALLPATGCSWLLVQKPPGPGERYRGPPECTSSVAAPVVDTVAAVLFGATGAIMLHEGATQPTGGYVNLGPALVAVGLAGVGTAAAFGASAGHGYSATARCRELKDWRERVPEADALGLSLGATAGSP